MNPSKILLLQESFGELWAILYPLNVSILQQLKHDLLPSLFLFTNNDIYTFCVLASSSIQSSAMQVYSADLYTLSFKWLNSIFLSVVPLQYLVSLKTNNYWLGYLKNSYLISVLCNIQMRICHLFLVEFILELESNIEFTCYQTFILKSKKQTNKQKNPNNSNKKLRLRRVIHLPTGTQFIAKHVLET